MAEIMTSQEVLNLARQTIPDTSKHHVFYKEGATEDIINCIKFQFPTAVEQTREFSRQLFGKCGRNVEKTLQTLYEFLKDSVPLMIDKNGVQDIKRPAFLVHRGASKGADCKSYSLFIASVLSNLDIPFRFKFVNWKPYDSEVKHVFIEAYPNDENRRRVLDVNMGQYNAEKLPNYNQLYIDMTRICAIGSTENKKSKRAVRAVKLNPNSLFDGKPMSQMSDIEIEIRLIRQGLRNERDTVKKIAGIGAFEVNRYDSAISMTNDLIGEIGAIMDDVDTENYESRIAGIGYNFATGVYDAIEEEVNGIDSIGAIIGKVKRNVKRKKKAKKQEKKLSAMAPDESMGVKKKALAAAVSPLENIKAKQEAAKKKEEAKLAKMTPAEKEAYLKKKEATKAKISASFKTAAKLAKQAATIADIEREDAYIGKLFKKIIKKVGKAVKTVAKATAKTVKKVAKATAKVVAKGVTTVAKGVATATVAAATMGTAKKAIKKLAKSTAKDAKQFAKANKDLVTAPIGAMAEVLLEDWCPKIGPFFQNTYLSDSDAKKYLNAKGQQKRNKAKKLRNLLCKHLNVDTKAFDKAIKNSIQKVTGKTLEANLQELKDKANGKASVSGIGVAPGVISSIMSAVMGLLSALLKKFAGKGAGNDFKGLNMSEEDAPQDDDWLSLGIQAAGNIAAKAIEKGKKGVKQELKNNVKSTLAGAAKQYGSQLANNVYSRMSDKARNIVSNVKDVANNVKQIAVNTKGTVDALSNLTNLQLVTGKDTPSAITPTTDEGDRYKEVDTLTGREVKSNGTTEGTKEALDVTANSPVLEVPSSASAVITKNTDSGVSNKALLIGAAAVGVIGVLALTGKKF